jgi:hypothetical protein
VSRRLCPISFTQICALWEWKLISIRHLTSTTSPLKMHTQLEQTSPETSDVVCGTPPDFVHPDQDVPPTVRGSTPCVRMYGSRDLFFFSPSDILFLSCLQSFHGCLLPLESEVQPEFRICTSTARAHLNAQTLARVEQRTPLENWDVVYGTPPRSVSRYHRSIQLAVSE